jgi:LPXTG-site transpeptidase (sortase) family protein
MALYFGVRAYGASESRDGIMKFAEARAAVESEAASNPSFGSRSDIHLAEAAGSEQTEGQPNDVPEDRVGALSEIKSADRPLAVLRIHRVALEVPVYGDVGTRNLNRGAGLIAGTGLPGDEGNVAIAAHRDSYFRVLEHVVVGDVLVLESLAGPRPYRVTELSIVEPDDLTPLDELGVSAVTLVTCYPFYFVGSAPQRYIVRAVAIE